MLIDFVEQRSRWPHEGTVILARTKTATAQITVKPRNVSSAQQAWFARMRISTSCVTVATLYYRMFQSVNVVKTIISCLQTSVKIQQLRPPRPHRSHQSPVAFARLMALPRNTATCAVARMYIVRSALKVINFGHATLTLLVAPALNMRATQQPRAAVMSPQLLRHQRLPRLPCRQPLTNAKTPMASHVKTALPLTTFAMPKIKHGATCGRRTHGVAATPLCDCSGTTICTCPLAFQQRPCYRWEQRL